MRDGKIVRGALVDNGRFKFVSCTCMDWAAALRAGVPVTSGIAAYAAAPPDPPSTSDS